MQRLLQRVLKAAVLPPYNALKAFAGRMGGFRHNHHDPRSRSGRELAQRQLSQKGFHS